MKKTAKDNQESSPEQVLHQYRKERHADLITRSNRLDELAYKTSERYDQWVLTLSGGALAISLTFLEKIAPKPAPMTLWLLGLSWLFFIAAILAGFFAIHFSREAIYRELEIAREDYNAFLSTSTIENMAGSQQPEKTNSPRTRVQHFNTASKWCLATGTMLLCSFALINLIIAKNTRRSEAAQEDIFRFCLPASVVCCITNTTTGATMSRDGNRPVEIKGVTPPAPDGSVKGVHVGDPASQVQGSYQPPRQQDSPPPPPPPPPPAKK